MHLADGSHTAWAVAGDVGDARLVTLGGDEDLTAADSFTGHVERLSERQELTATLDDADLRTVLVQLDPWLSELTDAGAWGLEVTVGWGSSATLTYPAAREDGVVIRVRRDYG